MTYGRTKTVILSMHVQYAQYSWSKNSISVMCFGGDFRFHNSDMRIWLSETEFQASLRTASSCIQNSSMSYMFDSLPNTSGFSHEAVLVQYLAVSWESLGEMWCMRTAFK